jgi:hypothetical protein
MAENGESFFRKVVRFVANPATDWAVLGTARCDGRAKQVPPAEGNPVRNQEHLTAGDGDSTRVGHQAFDDASLSEFEDVLDNTRE